MILHSKDEFDQLAEFDPNTGTYELLSRKQHPELTAAPASGSYSMVNGKVFSFYRKVGVLYLRVGDLELKLSDDVTSTIMQEGDHRAFQLIQAGNTLFFQEYRAPVYEVPLSIDPTPLVEEEDFDFLLFVHNVLTETRRRHGIYRSF